MSTDLIWNLTKKNNCFLKKQRVNCKTVMFGTDKLNLTNKYTYVFLFIFIYFSPRCIGYCKTNAIGVDCDGKRISLYIRSSKNLNKPKGMITVKKVNSEKAVSEVYIDTRK